MQSIYPAPTIARVVVPKSAVTTGVLMVGFALFTALAAQIVIPIPGSPVPITGQTFAVLLAGAIWPSSDRLQLFLEPAASPETPG